MGIFATEADNTKSKFIQRKMDVEQAKVIRDTPIGKLDTPIL